MTNASAAATILALERPGRGGGACVWFNLLVMEHAMLPHVFKSPLPSSPSFDPAARRGDRKSPLGTWLRIAFRNWERRKMIEALRALDDRLLRDIGIERSDIPRVVDGFTDSERAMQPVSPRVAHEYRVRRDKMA